VDDLAPFRTDDLEDHPWKGWMGEVNTTDATDTADTTRKPGAPSRWNANKDLSWQPLRPELVCEVGYDHLQGDRFRHATSFRRWRPDRLPASCTYSQLEAAVPEELARVFGAGA
jgi:ATP-dependent DNA ligase